MPSFTHWTSSDADPIPDQSATEQLHGLS